MKNRWSDEDAAAAVAHYAAQGVNEDLALRVYTTRLLGGDPQLVLHGGGNTSVKTTAVDVMGSELDVLCVKGSGWDMATIEPAGLPAVRLDPLQPLAAVDGLSDTAMVNVLRSNLLDSGAPTPSVETLLHAFIPHKFVDHTHADAIVALTDQADGEARCRELFGPRLAIVPYVMPGFRLSIAANAVVQQHPDAEGLILLNHGIFTFGATAREAYDRMIDFVDQAERAIAGYEPIAASTRTDLVSSPAGAEAVGPLVRGLLASTVEDGREEGSWLLDFRTGPEIRAFVDSTDLARYSQQGTVTPDHVIRTKPLPWITPAVYSAASQGSWDGARESLQAYRSAYRDYFARNDETLPGDRTELDSAPRVVLVPGLGLFGIGRSSKAAAIAADLAEVNVRVIGAAERMGGYRCISETDLFEVEYWSLEQAKLAGARERVLAGKVCIVTGGGGGIGAATASAFAELGACVAVLDLDADRVGSVANDVGGLGMVCDVTDSASVRAAFDAVCRRWGGVDIVVSNAGAAWQGAIGDIDEEVLRESFELNFFAHQSVAQAAVGVMRAQGTGGCLLFNASKQALNPGRGFGAYGLPKAATVFLMKQYAVDHGGEGIRSNAVNADRIRSGLLTDEMVASRAQARGVTESEYLAGNLLGVSVEAHDVAQAFVHLALSMKTTGAILTVDGGNIEASVR